MLVVDHALPFAELAARLQAAGWRRAEDPTAPDPLLAGEPEDGEWLGDEVRLRYRLEPATGLRALSNRRARRGRCVAGEPVAHREKAFRYLMSALTP